MTFAGNKNHNMFKKLNSSAKAQSFLHICVPGAIMANHAIIFIISPLLSIADESILWHWASTWEHNLTLPFKPMLAARQRSGKGTKLFAKAQLHVNSIYQYTAHSTIPKCQENFLNTAERCIHAGHYVSTYKNWFSAHSEGWIWDLPWEMMFLRLAQHGLGEMLLSLQRDLYFQVFQNHKRPICMKGDDDTLSPMFYWSRQYEMASNRDYLALFAHGLQVIFALAVLAIGLYKMTHRHALIVVRTDTWIIGVVSGEKNVLSSFKFFLSDWSTFHHYLWWLQSAKSLVIVTYQVCTDHISGLRKWRSLKANMILNIIETVFWIAAIVMTIMRMVKSCDGLGCILSGVVVGLGAILR